MDSIYAGTEDISRRFPRRKERMMWSMATTKQRKKKGNTQNRHGRRTLRLGLKRFEPGIDSRIDKNSYRFHFRLIDVSIQKKKIQSATPAREYAGYGAGGG